jgi:hypothetical protein
MPLPSERFFYGARSRPRFRRDAEARAPGSRGKMPTETANPGTGQGDPSLPYARFRAVGSSEEGEGEGFTNTVRMRFYFGLIAGLPPGVPGGGTTGMLSPERGGICFICGSTPTGGVTTPPERLSAELLDPLAGGTAGALGCLALSSSAATSTVTKLKNPIARKSHPAHCGLQAVS